MPGMTGLEVLAKAKAARPDVPIIMITAYGDEETRLKGREACSAVSVTPAPCWRTACRSAFLTVLRLLSVLTLVLQAVDRSWTSPL